MNMHVMELSPTAFTAQQRHKAFRQKIEERAAKLRDDKLAAALEKLVKVVAVEPEPEPNPVASERPKQNPWFAPLDNAGRAIPKHPGCADIQAAVAKHFGITRMEICSARRSAEIVRPRMVSCYLCKTLTPMSLPEIGRRHGGRDHSTIISAVRKIERLLLVDQCLAHDVAMLTERLGGAPQ